MRDYLQLYINGESYEISGNDAWLTLSQYLRNHLRMTGTKIVCEEGDCGSCSVLICDLKESQPTYKPIDSCIAFLFQLDGFHIVTVEGLAYSKELTVVQQAMIDCHGSQCGFCTPGFVMAMTGVMEKRHNTSSLLSSNSSAANCAASCDWRTELSGNLCRCTGYQSILDACEQIDSAEYQKLEMRYPIQAIQAMYAPYEDDSVEIEFGSQKLFIPTSIEEALQFKHAYPNARWIAGATDVGVQSNKRSTKPEWVVSLRRIAELQSIEVGNDSIIFGAAVSWSQMLPVLETHMPRYADIITIFGSPQIRNMGTIGGNIANASPIADSLPLLYVMDCELELVSSTGSRWVNINQFYSGYKQFDLKPSELIARVRIPKLTAAESMRLYKVSRRRDMDISTFTAAIRLAIESDVIKSASIAFGAVGPTVLRLPRTESFLIDKPFSLETMQEAGEIVLDEITPISDVRGSADYRYQLAKNALMKFYYEETQ